MPVIKPQTSAPPLSVSTLAGETWILHERAPRNFSMIVVYRGLHCPVCKRYLQELQSKLEELEALGVEVLALSTDNEARARQAQSDWELDKLTLGYGLSIDDARAWGLFISKSIREGETPMFAEPGLFLIKPDQSVYYIGVCSMPFGRPPIKDMLGALKYVTENDYPARGTD